MSVDSNEFQNIKKYVDNGKNENDIDFEIQKFSKSYVLVKIIDTNDIKAKILIFFYGSHLKNYVSILSNGLMINQDVSAHGLGEGIYFADIASAAAQFYGCESETGSLLVCQVAPGDSLECYEYTNDFQLPKEKHSAKGMSKIYPNPASLLLMSKCRWVNRSLITK